MHMTRTRAAWLIACGPPLVFVAGVLSLWYLGVALWPHQFFYWLMALAVFSPLAGAFVARRPVGAKVLCVVWVLLALMVAFVNAVRAERRQLDVLPADLEQECLGSLGRYPTRKRARSPVAIPTAPTTKMLGTTHFTVFDRLLKRR